MRRYLGWALVSCIPATLIVVLIILNRQNRLVRWLRMLVGKHEGKDGRS